MNKKLIAVICAVLVLAVAVVGASVYLKSSFTAGEISQDRAQQLIEDTFFAMPGDFARDSMKHIVDNTHFSVSDISYGTQKDIFVTINHTTIDAKSIILENKELLLGTVPQDSKTGMAMVSTKLKFYLDEKLLELLKDSKQVESTLEIEIYDTLDGFKVYTPDETVDAFFGGIVSASKEIEKTAYITDENQNKTDIGMNMRRGLNECYSLTYSSRKPDASGAVLKAWNNFKYDFERNFIANNNWKYITKGLWTTVRVTFFSTLIGFILGFLVAIVRVTYQKLDSIRGSVSRAVITVLDKICAVYLTVLRGTPVLVQLMIIYFVILMPIRIDKFIAAIICFGLNSGAYVAEIVRGGIMSVDNGQAEAGRSLGFGYASTMLYIIVPQAFKAVLPALANEFIVLLKETSVSAYIGLNDLARGGDIIRGVTYSAFMPLIAVALIYLVVVVFLTKLVGILERRLRNNER